MGFFEPKEQASPIALPRGLDVNPDPQPKPDGSVLGSAFRLENPIASAATSFDYDPLKPFDPDYRPWDELQGTEYEPYSERFVGARDVEDVASMKAQIDREIADRQVVDAAGGMGMLAEFSAALLSPSMFLPGGAVVKGAKGVSILKSGGSVAAAAAVATAVDEAVLQGTQQTRTGAESAFAIGGSVILGGILGAAAGKMTSNAFKHTSKQIEEHISAVSEYDGQMRSLSAAANSNDFRVRREAIFKAIDKVPGVRLSVRSDPILRTMLADNMDTRRVMANLVETPLQWKINEDGMSPLGGGVSAETAIKTRVNTEMVGALSHMKKGFSDYYTEGSQGAVANFTAPLRAGTAKLLSKDRKLSFGEFSNEVGVALRSGDKHPIPQVQAVAQSLRKEIFDKIKDEAIEVGIMDEGLVVKNAQSYFTRVYNQEMIKANLKSGGDQDIVPVLQREFEAKRARAQDEVAFDRTVDNLEADKFKTQERMRSAQRALDKARSKAVDKRDRAKAAITREGAVGRATGALRKLFDDRSDDLNSRVLDDEEFAAFKDAVKDARGHKRLKPRTLMDRIGDFGGIRDDGQGELSAILDDQTKKFVRKDGLDPDMMREALVEEGYLPEGSTPNDLYDAISRSQSEDIFTLADQVDVDRYEAAMDFRAMLDEAGVDVSAPTAEIVKSLRGNRSLSKATKAKASEASRSAGKAGRKEVAAQDRLINAVDRLEDAKALVKEIDDVVGPKVREEIDAAKADLKSILPELKKAKATRADAEYFAGLDDVEIKTAVEDTVRSIIGLKPGENAATMALADPVKARVLDVADEVLSPWLIDDAGVIMQQYFRSMVPDIEITRRFGGIEMRQAIDEIQTNAVRRAGAAKGERAKKRILSDADREVRDIKAMRDRMRGVYGVPADPTSGWIKGNRTLRTVSYMGHLGGMTLSAIPDVAAVLGRSGVTGSVGNVVTAITNPKRLFDAAKDMAEFGAAAEWHLNSRAMELSEIFDPYGRGSKFERGMAEGARQFGIATGMVPWNAGWKSVGGAAVASKMSKAAEAMRAGKATKKQRLALAENGIEPSMADRIAVQLDQYGDKDGMLWLPRGQDWDDQDAFQAFQRAMNREFDLMVITPGQDKPLSFSSETGKFFLQFKSFAFSAHHRILLSGIQRADADVFAQAVTAILLGGLVSNIKADLGGYDRREGAAFWEDAVDRSGLGGWLFEPYNALSGATGGRLSITGEPVSRFQSRSVTQGVLGPSVDMTTKMFEAVNAYSNDTHTYRDVRAFMRPVPGNNLTWLLGVSRKVEDALVAATGAKPRPE